MVNLRRRALFKPVAAGGLPAGYRQVAWINAGGQTKMVLNDWGISRPFDVELGINLVANLNFINYTFTGEQGTIGWCNNRKAIASSGYGNAMFDLNTEYVITAQFREADNDCGYFANNVNAGATPIKVSSDNYSIIPTLFGRYGDRSYRSSFKLYYFKIYDVNGNLTHDCVPCVDGNNSPCLYDIINKKTAYFLDNDGTNDASSATYGELTT